MNMPSKKFSRDSLLVFLVVCLCIILSLSGAFEHLNWKLFDVLITGRESIPEHRDNVVIVCIDQKSIDFFDIERGISWPWPRDFHGYLLSYLGDSGAKAVFFDIIFSEQEINRTRASGGDSDLADAIEDTGIAYLAVSGHYSGFKDSLRYDSKWILEETEPFHRFGSLPVYPSALYPIPEFMRGAASMGMVNLLPENDGIHRRYPLVSKLGEKYAPSIAYSIVKDLLDEETFEKNVLSAISDDSVVDDEGKILLNWYGKGGTDPLGETDFVFTYYSYHAVIASSISEERGEQSILPADAFKDKIVIIGSNAPGLLDLKATPFTHQNLYPGMEIHATAIENLMTGDYMHRVPKWIVMLLIALSAGILFGIDKYFNNLVVFISVYVFIIAAVFTMVYLLILTNNRMDSAEIITSGTLVFVGLALSGYFAESKDKRFLRKQFERYVNDSVLEEILANPNAVALKGRTLNATIMATDIADFTTISESMPPDEVVSQLNDYLSEVSESLIENSGFINKYIGDAILAVFGAFGESDHEKHACLGAVKAAEIVSRKIELALSENKTPLITRFGVTTGEMTLGNIGSKRKIEYTVIGDAVNSAFRLEGLNKFYNTTILASEYTKEGAGGDFVFRFLDILRYKGKVTPVRIYELIGLKETISSDKLRIIAEFEKGLELYHNRNFNEALEIFSKLSGEGDKPSDVFIRRCTDFIKTPPPPDWNGVWVMKRK
ncbi:CHASE2 domain-containing protein [Candidatus Latescibacterota bacterium]